MEINCLLFTVSRARVRLRIACFFIKSRLNALSLAALAAADVVSESEVDNTGTWGTAVKTPPPPPDFTTTTDDDDEDDDDDETSVGVVVVVVVVVVIFVVVGGGGGVNT